MVDKDTYKSITSCEDVFPVRVSYTPQRSRPREYYVLDFETTGLDPFTCDIIEIACIRVFANQVSAKFETLVKPKHPVPREVERLTGITNEMVETAPSLKDAKAGLAHFIGRRKAPIFAHNAPFDARVIWAHGIADEIEADCPINCSLELARRAFPKEKSHSLDALAKSLGLIRFDAHRALSDCLCTAQLIDVCYAQCDAAEMTIQGAQGQLSLTLTLPPCPRCGSNLIAKDGFSQAGSQMYRCKACNKKYSEKMKVTPSKRLKAPTFSEAKAKHPDGLLSCTHCGSLNIKLKDHRGGSHRYICKDCKRSMTFHDG